jgi:hypothetical protein
MPAPRVFVSSTCYDLRYIRENLKFFIRTLGYDPVLSEEGAVFYDPALHVVDACLADVPSCQLFVLVVGGRMGAAFKDSGRSITNVEYLEAIKAKIPIFALVERPVFEQYRLFQSNRLNKAIDVKKITYPNVDSTKIFDFIDEVQNQSTNNALVPFSDFEELQSYLRQQWASLLFRFLLTDGEAKRTGELVASLAAATENVEFLTRQLVRSVGDPIARTSVEFYDYLIGFEVIRDLSYWRLTPSPKAILQHSDLDSFCNGQIEVEDGEEYGSYTITHGGPPYKLGASKYEADRKMYDKVRSELLKRLKEKGLSLEQFLQGS